MTPDDFARTQILSAVRGAVGLRPLDEAAVRAAADALLDGVAATRPPLLAANLVDAFEARATTPKVAATVARIHSAAEFPAAVRAYLSAQGLPLRAALQPAAALRELDWQDITVHDAVAPEETVAVTQARFGIAETGTLVFHSAPDAPVLLHFLPLHEVVLLPAQAIVPYLEDYAQAIAAEAPPRNANLVTGASGTTDIEGRLVLGAHGPSRLHIVIAMQDAHGAHA